MKQLIVIGLWSIFIAAAFSLTSCSKQDITPPQSTDTDLKVFEKIVTGNQFVIMSFRSDLEDYTGTLGYAVDDYHFWDIAHNTGHIYGNTLQNPSAPFIDKEVFVITYMDNHNAYVKWLDPNYQPHNMRITEVNQSTCSFTLSYSEQGNNYYIHYSKLIP